MALLLCCVDHQESISAVSMETKAFACSFKMVIIENQYTMVSVRSLKKNVLRPNRKQRTNEKVAGKTNNKILKMYL